MLRITPVSKEPANRARRRGDSKRNIDKLSIPGAPDRGKDLQFSPPLSDAEWKRSARLCHPAGAQRGWAALLPNVDPEPAHPACRMLPCAVFQVRCQHWRLVSPRSSEACLQPAWPSSHFPTDLCRWTACLTTSAAWRSIGRRRGFPLSCGQRLCRCRSIRPVSRRQGSQRIWALLAILL